MPTNSHHRLAWPAPLAAGVLWAFLCLPGQALARGTAPIAVEVAEAFLELHTGPGRGFPVTHVVPRGDRIAVVKRRTDWYLLRDGRGHEGWAKRKEMAATLLALTGTPPDDGFRTPAERTAAKPAENTSDQPPRPAFNDGSYPDAENHHWEAGAGAGRRGDSKVLRATLSYLLDENLSVDTTLSQVLDGPRNEDLVLVGVTHTFHPERRVAPFVTLGLGVSRLHQEGALPADTREVGYAAAGFRVLLQQRLMFRADYRSFTAFSGRGNPKETNEWNVGFVFLF